ncbi:MAG: NTP transferase domain-containing protein, partial [Candidatus Omnitrophota bacterium]
MNKITAIVLAAGASTRMKTDIPKVLHKIGSKTILDRVIFNLKNAGVKDVVIVAGYKKEKIRECVQGVRFAIQEELLGSGDAVRTGIRELGKEAETVIVVCGDAPLINGKIINSMIKKHCEEKVSCTMLVCEKEDPFSYGRVIRDKEGKIERIVEEKDLGEDQKKIKEINTGTYCFKKEDLVNFIGKIEKNSKKKEFYLTDIIKIFTDNGEKIAYVKCSQEEAIGINSRKEIAEVNKIIKYSTIERLMEDGVTIVDPETTYVDETAEIKKDTVIFPNTVIEGNVLIGERCQIGPFARLRPGTRIADDVEIGNFVELNRAEIGKGTRIKHHSYIGDAVIGKNVNIGAGVITANYDGKNKNKTVIEDGAFIGVGTILIAPVTVGKK